MAGTQYNISAALKPLITVFGRMGITYAVGGSLASSVYGVPRSTLDVDLVADLSPAQVQALCSALEPDYYVDEIAISEAVAKRSSFNVIHLPTMMKIDVFLLKSADYDRQALRRARADTLADEPAAERFVFVAPEDVILHKLVWFRMGHEVSERQWHDVLGVLKVQWGRLDQPYLSQWSRALGVADLLERAQREAQNQNG